MNWSGCWIKILAIQFNGANSLNGNKGLKESGTVFYFRIRRDATCKYSAGGVEGFHETDAAKAGPV